MNEKLLSDMIKRLNGEFYIGVVGSVRSGKSLFIKRFMEIKVLPYVNNDVIKNKIIDELPQSAEGKVIMTVEPKFIPSNEICIKVKDEMNMKIRLVDSVGFVIPNSLGYYTDSGPRLVKTPWFNEPIPFKEAANIGTKKVITNHSTLGIVMTSDGTIQDFSREDYMSVEDEIVNELLELNKPFVIVVNSKNPNSFETKKICDELNIKYHVPALAINVLEMTENDIDNILLESLNEFPIMELNLKLPSFISNLDEKAEYRLYFEDCIKNSTQDYKKFKDIEEIKEKLLEYDKISKVVIEEIDPGLGLATMKIDIVNGIYEEILKDLIGDITDKGEFISRLSKYKKAYNEYSNYSKAINEALKGGYGISFPKMEDMILESPEILKQGNKYGVKLKAVAPSIHMIKVDVNAVFEPMIGSEEQSKSLIENLKDENEIWDLEIFGRKLNECLNDGIRAKINMFPEKGRDKIRMTIEKIINNNSGGLIAIIL